MKKFIVNYKNGEEYISFEDIIFQFYPVTLGPKGGLFITRKNGKDRYVTGEFLKNNQSVIIDSLKSLVGKVITEERYNYAVTSIEYRIEFHRLKLEKKLREAAEEAARRIAQELKDRDA